MSLETPETNNNEREPEVIRNGNELILKSTPEAIDNAVAILEQELEADGYWDEGEIKDLILGVREALANAYKHGNKKDPNKDITLNSDINSKGFFVKVQDEGRGYDHEKVPDPLDPENLMKTSGRGLLMLRHYFDKVEPPVGDSSTIFLTKYKNKK